MKSTTHKALLGADFMKKRKVYHTMCGLHAYSVKLLSLFWKTVTCKNCLKHKRGN